MLSLSVLFVGVWVLVALLYWRRRLDEHRFRDGKTRPGLATKQRPSRMPIIKDRYHREKVPENLDAIVIGSGCGGLGTAACLARYGWRVLVLEQHDVAGGCTHTFEDMGVEFDTGTHYVGKRFGRQEQECFSFMGIGSESVQWDEMSSPENNYTYDMICVGEDAENHYPLRASRERFIDDMTKRFPDEHDNLVAYVDLCKKVSKMYRWYFVLKCLRPNWLGSFLVRVCFKLFGSEYLTKTADEVLATVTPNKQLQRVLAGQWGDHGVVPDDATFFMHAGVVMHYMYGAVFPNKGSSVMAEKFCEQIEKCGGGRILVKARVQQIIVENNTAVGVRMENGDVFKAGVILSDAGFLNTRDKLLSPEVRMSLPSSWRNFEAETGATTSCSMLYLFVSLEGTPEELKLPSHNIWSWPGVCDSTTYGEQMAKFAKDPLNTRPPTFIGFPCAKDNSWSERYPGRSNALVLSIAEWSDYEKWENTESGKRDDASYDALKAKWSAILKAELIKYFPHLDKPGVIKGMDLGTPLSFNHYISSTKGEVYGLEAGKWRFSAPAFDVLRPTTPIEGLFMTGQDVISIGIVGAAMSGFLTANCILDYGSLGSLVNGQLDMVQHCKSVGLFKSKFDNMPIKVAPQDKTKEA